MRGLCVISQQINPLSLSSPYIYTHHCHTIKSSRKKFISVNIVNTQIKPSVLRLRRYMISRVAYQVGMRVMQGIKDQVLKCDCTIKSYKDSYAYGSSSRKARELSGAVDSTAFKAAAAAAKIDKLKQAEDSFRTVLYLSCWGPN